MRVCISSRELEGTCSRMDAQHLYKLTASRQPTAMDAVVGGEPRRLSETQKAQTLGRHAAREACFGKPTVQVTTHVVTVKCHFQRDSH